MSSARMCFVGSAVTMAVASDASSAAGVEILTASSAPIAMRNPIASQMCVIGSHNGVLPNTTPPTTPPSRATRSARSKLALSIDPSSERSWMIARITCEGVCGPVPEEERRLLSGAITKRSSEPTDHAHSRRTVSKLSVSTGVSAR